MSHHIPSPLCTCILEPHLSHRWHKISRTHAHITNRKKYEEKKRNKSIYTLMIDVQCSEECVIHIVHIYILHSCCDRPPHAISSSANNRYMSSDRARQPITAIITRLLNYLENTFRQTRFLWQLFQILSVWILINGKIRFHRSQLMMLKWGAHPFIASLLC